MAGALCAGFAVGTVCLNVFALDFGWDVCVASDCRSAAANASALLRNEGHGPLDMAVWLAVELCKRAVALLGV